MQAVIIQVPAIIPRQVLTQKIKARVLAVKTALDGYTDVSGLDLDQAARQMAAKIPCCIYPVFEQAYFKGKPGGCV
jgi:hypothetical protein